MIGKHVPYCIIVQLLLVIILSSGCLTSYVRYTRPSYIKRQQKKLDFNIADSQNIDTLLNSLDALVSPESKIKTKPKEKNHRNLKKIVNSYIGVRYRYGGTNRRGMDCSGFVWRVFHDLGHKNFLRIPSSKMTKLGKSVRKRNIAVGDLVFFKRRMRVNHVGIYMGNNKFAHATTQRGVTYTSLDDEYFSKRFYCIRRVY